MPVGMGRKTGREPKASEKLSVSAHPDLMDALRSRVGAAENTLLGSSDLTTLIGPATGRWFLHSNKILTFLEENL